MAKVNKTARKKPAPKGKKPAARKAPAKTRAAKSKPVKKAVAAKSVHKKPAPSPAPRPPRVRGVPEQLRDAALKVLDERQAEDIMTFDLGGRSTMADYLIVASGRAARQLAAIAHYLGEAFAKLGVSRTRIEGLPEANWVLVDGGDVIVHLFLPEVRGFYKIEDIWSKSA